jgi:hypothetical protein
VDPQLLEDIGEQVVSDVKAFSEAINASSTPKHQRPDIFLDIAVEINLETSP